MFFSVIPALTGYIINGILTQGELFLDCARKIWKLENEFEILNFQCLSDLRWSCIRACGWCSDSCVQWKSNGIVSFVLSDILSCHSFRLVGPVSESCHIPHKTTHMQSLQHDHHIVKLYSWFRMRWYQQARMNLYHILYRVSASSTYSTSFYLTNSFHISVNCPETSQQCLEMCWSHHFWRWNLMAPWITLSWFCRARLQCSYTKGIQGRWCLP